MPELIADRSNSRPTLLARAVLAATRHAPPDAYAQDLEQAPAGGAALLAEEVRAEIATQADGLRKLLDAD